MRAGGDFTSVAVLTAIKPPNFIHKVTGMSPHTVDQSAFLVILDAPRRSWLQWSPVVDVIGIGCGSLLYEVSSSGGGMSTFHAASCR